MPGAVTVEVDVDEHQGSMLVEWGLRIVVWMLAVVSVRRREAGPYGPAVRALRRVPDGGEAGGTLPDGTAWYVRVPAAPRGGESDGR